MNEPWRRIARRVLPLSVRRGISRHTRWPPVGAVRFGSLGRVTPVSRDWGSSRGVPVDRHYIEAFLAERAEDIRGRVLEIKDATYTRRFGGKRVQRSDVVHPVEGNPDATIVADLTSGEGLDSGRFDCVICTQTLHLIYDVRSAIETLHRVLAPGGVLLVTTPGISQISRHDMDRWGDFWRFTSASARRLFEERFAGDEVDVRARGNVKAAVAFLHGLASRELLPGELERDDPDYELLITVRAIKRAGTGGAS